MQEINQVKNETMVPGSYHERSDGNELYHTGLLNPCNPYTIILPHTLKTCCYDILFISTLVRGDRDSRANLMPIYGDLYQIKL